MTDLGLKGLKAVLAGASKEIAFMASPACPFMTGTNVEIDGGVTKRVQY